VRLVLWCQCCLNGYSTVLAMQRRLLRAGIETDKIELVQANTNPIRWESIREHYQIESKEPYCIIDDLNMAIPVSELFSQEQMLTRKMSAAMPGDMQNGV